MSKDSQSFAAYVEEMEYLLRQVSLLVRQRGRQILSKFDITPPQFNALLELVNHGELTMGELCSRLYLASSTVTDLVDRMERNGLVTRVRDSGDRRVIRLRVLEAGHRLIEAVMDARKAYLSNVLQRVDHDEREGLLQALRHIHQVMMEQEVQRPG